MEVFVDSGYRTGLGTGFYDRVGEVSRLDKLVRSYRLVIVYGPRNAGKSELVRYWARKRAKIRVVALQADRLRAARALGGLEGLLEAPEERVKEAILSELSRRAGERLSLLSLAYAIYEAILSVGARP